MAIGLFGLKYKHDKMKEANIKWNPGKEMKSRAITIQSHQVCTFAYNKGENSKAPENKFSTQIGVHIAKKEQDPYALDKEGDSDSDSESSFNLSDEDDMDYVINDYNSDAEIND